MAQPPPVGAGEVEFDAGEGVDPPRLDPAILFRPAPPPQSEEVGDCGWDPDDDIARELDERLQEQGHLFLAPVGAGEGEARGLVPPPAVAPPR